MFPSFHLRAACDRSPLMYKYNHLPLKRLRPGIGKRMTSKTTYKGGMHSRSNRRVQSRTIDHRGTARLNTWRLNPCYMKSAGKWKACQIGGFNMAMAWLKNCWRAGRNIVVVKLVSVTLINLRITQSHTRTPAPFIVFEGLRI